MTTHEHNDTWAAYLQRLATALSGYHDLKVALRGRRPVPCLTVHNTTAPLMSETVTVNPSGDRLAYTWSWGQQISDASDPQSAAQAIAYVLKARGAGPGGPIGQKLATREGPAS